MADETFVQIVKIHLVSSLEKEKMFGILREYFAHVEYDTFLKDLGEKHWVIVLRGEGNQIVGFSTIQVIEHAVDGREVVYVFSGDTIVEKEFWQSNLLAPAFTDARDRALNIIIMASAAAVDSSRSEAFAISIPVSSIIIV